MKALVLEQPGPEPRLTVRDIPVPQVSSDRVLVRVEACGLCHHDLLVMRGILRRGVKEDVVLGHEISGIVEAVGPYVGGLSPGDLVVSIQTDACGRCDRCAAGLEHRCMHGRGIGHSIDGGFAEFVSIRASSLVKIPPDADLTGACLLGCPMGVVQRAINKVGRVQPGERVMVTGGGGGLGSHAIQLAKAIGAEVYAVTSRESKTGALELLGADQALCIGDVDFSEVVLALTEDAGVDVALDTVGSPHVPFHFSLFGPVRKAGASGGIERARRASAIGGGHIPRRRHSRFVGGWKG